MYGRMEICILVIFLNYSYIVRFWRIISCVKQIWIMTIFQRKRDMLLPNPKINIFFFTSLIVLENICVTTKFSILKQYLTIEQSEQNTHCEK